MLLHLKLLLCLTLILISSMLQAKEFTARTDSGTPDKQPQLENTIAVMTYNIQQLGYSNWMANHFEKERLALIPQTILGLEQLPDILVLQEVFTDYSYEFITTHLNNDYPFHTEVVAQDCNSKDWTSVSGDCNQNTWKGNGGVLILSRWPIDEKHAYVYNTVRVSPTFDFLARKGIVYASILVGHEPGIQKIHILGTHLQAGGESHDIRMLQLSEMRHWFDGFNVPKSEAVILAGDFNVSSKHPEELAEMLQLTASKLALADGEIGSVSPSTNRYRNLIKAGRNEKTLDFILYRSDHLAPVNKPTLTIINFKSRNAWQGQRLFNDIVELNDLSDHYPTFMIFNYGGSAGFNNPVNQ